MMQMAAAVVGAGLMGRWHADAIRRSGHGIAAVVDPDAEAARALARAHGGCPTHTSLGRALEETPSTVVHVCAPLAAHEELAAMALEAGRHVLVEKPLAPDASTTARLLDLAREQDRLLCPVHQFLFQRGATRARKALESIGPLRQLEATALSAGADHVPEGERDTIVADILPHPLSLMEALLPGSLDATEWHASRPAAGELRALGQAAEGGPGPACSILISMSGRPTENTLRLVGENGSAYLDLFHGFAVVQRGTVSRAAKIARPFRLAASSLWEAGANLVIRAVRREPAYPGLRELVSTFYRAAESGGASPISTEATLAVARARDSICAALGESGRPKM